MRKFALILMWVVYALCLVAFVGVIIYVAVSGGGDMWKSIILCICGFVAVCALIGIGFIPKVNIPAYINIYLALLVAVSIILGQVFGFFNAYPWFNKLQHGISGAVTTLIGFTIARRALGGEDVPLFFIVLFAFCFSLAIGVLWEILEFGIDASTGQNMQRWQDQNADSAPYQSGLIDTMWDIIVHTLAALLISILGYFYLRWKRRVS